MIISHIPSQGNVAVDDNKDDNGDTSTPAPGSPAPTTPVAHMLDGSAASSTALAAVVIKCVACGADTATKPYVVQRKSNGTTQEVRRCHDCNALQSRVRRALTSDTSVAWCDLDKCDKQRFFQESHGLVGLELKAAIRSTITKSSISAQHESFTMEGTWMDETTVRKTFENRPAQRDAILENAKRFMCPVQKVEIFEVPEYKSVAKESRDTSTTQEHELSTEGTQKGTNKRAAAGDDVVKIAKQKTHKPLSDAQVKRLQKHIDTDKALVSTSDGLDLTDVPTKLSGKVCLQRAELDAVHAEMHIAISEKAGFGLSQCVIVPDNFHIAFHMSQ